MERSYFWDGASIGDAVAAPYSSSVFGRIVMERSFGNDDAHVVYTRDGVFGGCLAVVAGSNDDEVVLKPGRAVWRNRVYENDADITFDISADGTYYVYLEYDTVGRTIRSGITTSALGPDQYLIATVRRSGTSHWVYPKIKAMPGTYVVAEFKKDSGAGVTSISFSDIPPIFRRLELSGILGGYTVSSTHTDAGFAVRLNGNTSSAYRTFTTRFRRNSSYVARNYNNETGRFRMGYVTTASGSADVITHIRCEFPDPLFEVFFGGGVYMGVARGETWRVADSSGNQEHLMYSVDFGSSSNASQDATSWIVGIRNMEIIPLGTGAQILDANIRLVGGA